MTIVQLVLLIGAIATSATAVVAVLLAIARVLFAARDFVTTTRRTLADHERRLQRIAA